MEESLYYILASDTPFELFNFLNILFLMSELIVNDFTFFSPAWFVCFDGNCNNKNNSFTAVCVNKAIRILFLLWDI